MSWVISLSAATQAVLTAIIAYLTFHYARSTQRLVEVQIEPELRVSIPEDALTADIPGAIENVAGCRVTDVRLQVSLPAHNRRTGDDSVRKCIHVQSWEHELAPKQRIYFDTEKVIDEAASASDDRMPTDWVLDRSFLHCDVACRRASDGKPFSFASGFRVVDGTDGPVVLTAFQPPTGSERYILVPGGQQDE